MTEKARKEKQYQSIAEAIDDLVPDGTGLIFFEAIFTPAINTKKIKKVKQNGK